MNRSPRGLLWILGAPLLLATSLVPAEAEKAPMPPGALEKMAAYIVRGTVARIYTRSTREGSYEVTRHLAEVHLTAVEKGDEIPLDRPLYARYWTQAWRGPGMTPPGTGGHAPIPKEGQGVRLHLGREGFQLLSAEEAKAPPPDKPLPLEFFPQGWCGTWRGDLTIQASGRAPETTTMEIEIAQTDSPDRWHFRIRYGDQPVRPYALLVRDAAAGSYEIDEGNSIVIPATLFNNDLTSAFSLNGNLLTARYRLEGDTLHFDLTQVPLAPSASTGGSGAPSVGAHAVHVSQRAQLQR